MDNIKTYINKYQQGYGIVYPEAHVIRLYEKFLKFEMGIDRAEGQRILDFGCGSGTHLEYFLSKGFDVYGIDVIPQAIEQAQKKIPTHKQIDQLNFLHARQFVSRWILSILRRTCVMTARDGSENI